ncbi:MAG: diacylglycerol kinase family protein [Ferruginibacter sp.]
MKFIRSLRYAWQGVQYCFKTQLNFRIQLTVLLMVIIAGFVLKISNTEWLFIMGFSALVLVLELMNTAIEHLCDIITKDFHPAIKIIKDVSAAAVLLGAAASIVTGIIIFIPKIIVLLKL